MVCDNLNTHNVSSLYLTFEPAEALRIAKRLQIVHTPVHGSWLNIAEIELSALTRQCLDRRIPTRQEVASQATAWHHDRNTASKLVQWHFTTDDARAAGIEGKVRVELTLTPEGTVADAKVIEGLGHGLDEAAIAALRGATFAPATRCGKPVAATFTVSVRFTL